MRTSSDVYINGALWAGFDYDLQVWVEEGIVLVCGHPADMACGCNQWRYAGISLASARMIWSTQ